MILRWKFFPVAPYAGDHEIAGALGCLEGYDPAGGKNLYVIVLKDILRSYGKAHELYRYGAPAPLGEFSTVNEAMDAADNDWAMDR
jgi:hypothetical protein